MKCRLKHIMYDKKMTQRELAKKLNVSESAMSSIVQGQSFPRVQLAIKIAKELNVTVEDIWKL